MSEAPGMIAYELGFEVENAAGSGVFVEIAKVTNISPPNDSVDDVEATHMKSPGRTKEFVAGLRDPGEMSLDLNHIPGSDTDTFIIDWRTSGETRSCRIVYPDDYDVDADTFPAYVRSYAPTMSVGALMTSTLGLKVAGQVVRS